MDATLQTLSDGFAYEIGDAEEADDGNVIVDVTISSKQVLPVIAKAFTQMLSSALSGSYTTPSDIMSDPTVESQMTSDLGKLIQEEVRSAEPTKTDLRVTMVEENGEWGPDEDSTSGIYGAITGYDKDLGSSSND